MKILILLFFFILILTQTSNASAVCSTSQGNSCGTSNYCDCDTGYLFYCSNTQHAQCVPNNRQIAWCSNDDAYYWCNDATKTPVCASGGGGVGCCPGGFTAKYCSNVDQCLSNSTLDCNNYVTNCGGYAYYFCQTGQTASCSDNTPSCCGGGSTMCSKINQCISTQLTCSDVDQAQTLGGSYFSCTGIGNCYLGYQTFVPSVSSYLYQMSLKLSKAGNPPGSVSVGISTASGNWIGGSSILQSSITTTPQVYQFVFSPGIFLEAGQTYKFNVSGQVNIAAGGLQENYLLWANDNNPYTLGGYDGYPDWDLYFITFMHADTTPPTSTITPPPATSWINATSGLSLTVTDTDENGNSNLGTCEYRVESNGVETKPWTQRPCNITNNTTLVSVGSNKDCRDEGANKCKVYVRATDNSNNTGTVRSATFNIDYSPPSVMLTSTPDAVFLGEYLNLRATANDTASGNASLQIYMDDFNPAGATSASGYTTCTVSRCTYSFMPRSLGNHTVYAKATDAAGNTVTSPVLNSIISPVPVFASYYDSGNKKLKFAKSSDQGATWQLQSIRPDSSNTGASSSLYAYDDKTIFVAYIDSSNTSNTQLKVAKTTDGGSTWSIQSINDANVSTGGITIEGVDDKKIFIAYTTIGYKMKVANTSDGGSTWNIATVDTGSLFFNPALRVVYSATPTTAIISYGAMPVGSFNRILKFSKSVDGGSTWLTPVVVDSSSNVGQYSAIDSFASYSNRLTIQYYDTTNRTLKKAYTDDSGATWTNYQMLPANSNAGTGISIRRINFPDFLVAFTDDANSALKLSVVNYNYITNNPVTAATSAGRSPSITTTWAEGTNRQNIYIVNQNGAGRLILTRSLNSSNGCCGSAVYNWENITIDPDANVNYNDVGYLTNSVYAPLRQTLQMVIPPAIAITGVETDTIAPYQTNNPTPQITFVTDINANCKYALDTNTSYANMTEICSGGQGTTNHNCTLPSLGTDGNKTIYLACADTSGVTSSQDRNTTLNIVLDTVAPSATVSITRSGDQFNATLTCADAGSGCNTTKYCIDTTNSCAPTIAAGASPVNLPASSYIRYQSIDNAGNTDTIKSALTGTGTIPPSSPGCVDAGEQNRATGLVSAPDFATDAKFNTSGGCVKDRKAEFVRYKIPTFDDLKSLYYTQK